MSEPNDAIQATPPARKPPAWDEPESDRGRTGGSSDDGSMSVLAHAGGFITWIVLPLVVWQMKKDQSRFASEHAKEALNFQITLTIYYLVGCLIFPVVMVYETVFVILACRAALRGEPYRIPLNIRFVK